MVCCLILNFVVGNIAFQYFYEIFKRTRGYAVMLSVEYEKLYLSVTITNACSLNCKYLLCDG